MLTKAAVEGCLDRGKLAGAIATSHAVEPPDCVVLCGGRGRRLRDVVADVPKPMATVLGRPFLDWLVLALERQGLRRLVLATGYMSDVIEAHFTQPRSSLSRIDCSREPDALGTAGALRLAAARTGSEQVLVINGDTYCQPHLVGLQEVHRKAGALATLQLAHVRDASRYGAVKCTDAGGVVRFSEKNRPGPAWIYAGVCLIERKAIEAFPSRQPLSMERDVLPNLVNQGLYAVATPGPFVDIGTPESYARAGLMLSEEIAALEMHEQGAAHFHETLEAQRRTARDCVAAATGAADLIAEAFRNGGKLMLCGNGGSAADCQHVAAEFVSRLRRDFERPPLPAVALTTDTSFLTAYSNDCGYTGVFERQVRALGRPGDVLLCISTSGGSANVVRAARAAGEIGIRVIALCGESGELSDEADLTIAIPSRSTQIIQECMLPIEHIICELVEEKLFGSRRRGLGA
jgi:D-sedoheptulose 7-phosphate isomerase